MVGIVILALIAALSAAVLAKIGRRGSLPLDVIVATASLIVAVSLTLSLVGQFHRTTLVAFLGVGALGATGALVAHEWRSWAAGAHRRVVAPLQSGHSTLAGRETHPGERVLHLLSAPLTVLAAAVLLAVIGAHILEATEQSRWSEINKDSLSYHVPRAYFWLEEGRIAPLEVGDFRWNQFPPNSSILIAWTMATGLFPAWSAFPQHVGLALLAVGALLLTRRLGGSLAASATASIAILAFPTVFAQVRSSGNDVLLAGLGVAAAYYLLAIAQRLTAGETPRWPDVIMLAASIGLGCGTKATFLLLGPAGLLAAAVAAAAGRRVFAAAPRRTLAQAGAAIAIVSLLGAGGYVRNMIEVGHPVASSDAQALMTTATTGASMPLQSRLFMALYQTGTLEGLEEAAPAALSIRVELAQRTASLLNIPFASIDALAARSYLAAPNYDAGYGLVAFLALVAALLITPIGGAWAAFKRDPAWAGIALTAFASLSVLFFLSLEKGWTPTFPRYFVTALPLAVVALFAAADRIRLAGSVLVIAATAYSVWLVAWLTQLAPHRIDERRLAAIGAHSIDLNYSGLAYAMEAVRRAANGGPVTIYGKIDAWAWAPVSLFPELDYRIGRGDPASAAGLVLIERADFNDPRSFPLPRFAEASGPFLQKDDLPEFVRENAALYGMSVAPDGSEVVISAMAIEPLMAVGRAAPSPPRSSQRIILPSFLLDASEGELFEFRLTFASALPLSDLLLSVSCDTGETTFTLEPSSAEGASDVVVHAPMPPGGHATRCTLNFASPMTARIIGAADVRILPPAVLRAAPVQASGPAQPFAPPVE